MAQKIITLDIDGDSIRLLEARGRHVSRWASAPLEPGLVTNGSIIAPEALGSRIRELMRSSGIKGGRVIASLSGLYSVSRVLNLPKPSAESNWEATEKGVAEAMPTGELSTRWQALAADEDKQQVLAVGVPRELLAAEVQALQSAGVRPSALELKGMALARAVNRPQALILNMEPSSLDVVVVVQGIPQIVHTTSQKADLPAEERAERLASALDQAVTFYNSHHPGSPVNEATPLFLVGRSAEEPTVAEKVQDRVPYPVEALAPPLEFPAHLPLSAYAVNLGLALRQMPLPAGTRRGVIRLDIDLLHGVSRRPRLTAKKAGSYGALLLAMVLVFLLFNAASTATARTVELQGERGAAQAQLTFRRAELTKLVGVQAKIEEYEEIVAGRGYLTNQWRLVEGIVPGGVELKSMVLSKTTVSITGTASGYAQALAYTNALRGSGRFSEVELPRMSSEGGSFSITATVGAKP